MGRDTFQYTRLLKAPSSLALNTAREGAATASLGNLFQCLTALITKYFFLISDLNPPYFILKPLKFKALFQPPISLKPFFSLKPVPLQVLEGCYEVPLLHIFLYRHEQPVDSVILVTHIFAL